MNSKPYGLTPIEVEMVNLAFGSSYPLKYGELCLMANAIFKGNLPDSVMRPRFLKSCEKGLLTFTGWDQLRVHPFHRRVEATRIKAVDVIRDVGILLGGEYNYYRAFDPFEDYAKNPNKLDRFAKPRKMKVPTKQRGRGPTREQIFADHLANVRRDPKNYRWN